jgi:hypothetical protein
MRIAAQSLTGSLLPGHRRWLTLALVAACCLAVLGAAGCPRHAPAHVVGSGPPPDIPPGWPLPGLTYPSGAVRHPFNSVIQTKQPPEYACQTTINGHPGWIVGFDTALPWTEVVAFFDGQASALGMSRVSLSDHEAEAGDRVSIASWEGAGYSFRVDHANFQERHYPLIKYDQPGYSGYTLMLEDLPQ